MWHATRYVAPMMRKPLGFQNARRENIIEDANAIN
jgi:hypothetical protein